MCFGKAHRILLPVLFILLTALAFCAERNFWWVFSSFGDDISTGGQPAVGPVHGEGDGSYGFWYDGIIPTICITLTPDDWDIDSIDVSETRTMSLSEAIQVSNCGNCNAGLGLCFVSSSPRPWTVSYASGENRFVLRGRFSATSTPPSIFDASADYIRDDITWASSATFGGYGYNSPQGVITYLWLQFIAPRSSTVYGGNTMTFELTARAVLP